MAYLVARPGLIPPSSPRGVGCPSALEEAREMFADGAVLEVVPLLQTFLWPEGL